MTNMLMYLWCWTMRDLDFPNIEKKKVSNSSWKLVPEIYYEDECIYVYTTSDGVFPLTREEVFLR